MGLTRRRLIGSAGAAALSAAGLYELVDRLGSAPHRRVVSSLPQEQHLLGGLRVVVQEGVEVVVPPLHHEVVTAKIGVKPTELRAAQGALEETLRQLERQYERTPAGLGVTVAWGLPYFRRYVRTPAASHLPLDLRASTARGEPVGALLDAIRFPSDPRDTLLEDNDVAFLLRSDILDHIEDSAKQLIERLGVFEATSVRKGFAGGGFDGGEACRRRWRSPPESPGPT